MSITFSGNGSGGGIRMSGGGGGGNVINGVTVSGTPTSGQVLTATSSTAASWAGGASARPNVDGDHTDVWYMDVLSGASFPNEISGRSSFTSVSNITCLNGFCFKNYPSAVFTGTYVSSGISAQTNLSLNLSTTIPTSQDYSFEFIYLIPTDNLTWDYSPNSGYANVVKFDAADGSNFTDYRQRNAGSYVWTWSPGGGDQSFNYGSNRGDIFLGVPHHFMTAVTGNSFSFYIDGVLRGTASVSRTQPLSRINIWLNQNSSIADIRISKIARDVSYAVAATRAMKAM